jgi:hypothetical protein
MRLHLLSQIITTDQDSMKINPATHFRLSRISNRHFLVRLKTLLTHTKQTPDHVSNRNISDPPRQKHTRFFAPYPPRLSIFFPTFIWNFQSPWGEYVTTRAAGRPTY